jgi:hypothetical protein
MSELANNPMQYSAGLREKNGVVVRGKTINAMIRKIKKLGNIDCRSVHTRQTIFSEFRPGAWGVFYWNTITGSLDAWIEFE